MNNEALPLCHGEFIVSSELVNGIFLYMISSSGRIFVRDLRLDFVEPRIGPKETSIKPKNLNTNKVK